MASIPIVPSHYTDFINKILTDRNSSASCQTTDHEALG